MTEKIAWQFHETFFYFTTSPIFRQIAYFDRRTHFTEKVDFRSKSRPRSSRFQTTDLKVVRSIFGDRLWTLVQNCECFCSTQLWRKHSSHDLQCENVVIFPYLNHSGTLWLWTLLEFTLTHFWQKFRESNGFTKLVTRVDFTKYFGGER